MFRFWASDTRGSDKTADASRQTSPDCAGSVARSPSGLPTPVSPHKRRPSFLDTGACQAVYSPAKRAKTEDAGDLPSPISASADGSEQRSISRERSMALDIEAAREAIEFQFGLEILMKHDELRLVNQELAKCQVALEQVRRCHLIPYPVQCPTPSQMLDISSGKGPALRSSAGGLVPKWAPPFGVVEGPYARHYAKWLIPDPVFDGVDLEAPGSTELGRAKGAAEVRTTRSSISDASGSVKPRPARSLAGQRLQSLSSGYPQPRDKQSGCILKRADGVTVKLVCIDCHRWDFSSTQGFINHCRIAHKRDFKSHEEAAVRCGHPVDVNESGAVVGGEDTKMPTSVVRGLVHPLARDEAMSDSQACQSLLTRIRASVELYKAGRLPSVSGIPGVSTSARMPAVKPPASFVGSADAPYLSMLMQKKKVSGNLREEVTEAKAKVDWDWLSLGEDSDAEEPGTVDSPATPDVSLAAAARTPAVMRMPSRAVVPPSQPPAAQRAASSRSNHATPRHSVDFGSTELPETPLYDEDVDMDADLSPNTMTSNHAPSLVSDDGEYDDSDDASSSVASDDEGVGAESEAETAEINSDGDSDAGPDTPRPVSRRRGSNTKAVRLKKDDIKHVTFVTPTPPVPTNTKGRRRKL